MAGMAGAERRVGGEGERMEEGRSGFSWLCPAAGQASGRRVSSQNVKSLNSPEVPPGQSSLPNSIFALPAPLPSELQEMLWTQTNGKQGSHCS